MTATTRPAHQTALDRLLSGEIEYLPARSRYGKKGKYAIRRPYADCAIAHRPEYGNNPNVWLDDLESVQRELEAA